MRIGKIFTTLTMVAMLLVGGITPASAQLNKLVQKAKGNAQRITNVVEKAQDAKEAKQAAEKEAAYQADLSSGKVYYVNAATGSNRNDGTTPQTAIKDLQKAINIADEGSEIRVAEGNYLGTLDQGYIEVTKYMSIIGGYNSDFTDRNPIKYITWIRPDERHLGTSGAHASMDINVTGKAKGVVLIDGFSFDKGQYNRYCAYDPTNPVAAAPEGCETGRTVCVDESPSGVPMIGGAPLSVPLMRGNVQGHVTIRNCTFVNGYDFAISMGCKGGHFNIYNNVFVANRMTACEVRGMMADQSLCSMEFHHNTVLFTWCRTKVMDGQGVAFRYHTGISTKVYNNILGCSNMAALERVFLDSNAQKEAARFTAATNNLFFMNFNTMHNGNADIMLPSGGGKWLFVDASRFEDVEQLNEYEGNMEMPKEHIEKFTAAIDAAYLKGYLGINIQQAQSYDRNSGANQLNRLFGQNQQGTEIVRVSMFGNRYPYMKAFDLYGVIDGYGAQMPQ